MAKQACGHKPLLAVKARFPYVPRGPFEVSLDFTKSRLGYYKNQSKIYFIEY